MRHKLFVPIFILLIPAGIFAQSYTSADSLKWVLGKWQQVNEKSITTESWIKLSSNTFDGSTKTRSKADNKITFEETLRIVEMSGEVFYIAKVSHNELPIAFKLTSCSDSTAVFENTNHDFPKKIVYKLSKDKEILNITVGSEEREFTVVYKKTSEN
jgi:hypothetical protein